MQYYSDGLSVTTAPRVTRFGMSIFDVWWEHQLFGQDANPQDRSTSQRHPRVIQVMKRPELHGLSISVTGKARLRASKVLGNSCVYSALNDLRNHGCRLPTDYSVATLVIFCGYKIVDPQLSFRLVLSPSPQDLHRLTRTRRRTPCSNHHVSRDYSYFYSPF